MTNDQFTYFAPAERANIDQLAHQVAAVSCNPVIDAVMGAFAGLLAVLNEQRQILAINNTMLEMLNIHDPTLALGLRPGEALRCVHADEQPGGCGTGPYCVTCGAAIAIVASLTNDRAEERNCVATVEQNGQPVDLYLRVRCCPITFEGQRFLLLLMNDISTEQQRAALERVFIHDINNMLTALVANSQLLDRRVSDPTIRKFSNRIKQISQRLAKEVEIQTALSGIGASSYQPLRQPLSAAWLVSELREMLARHPAAEDKQISLHSPSPDLCLSTDPALLQRVLSNMLINALEATDEGGEVKLWLEPHDSTVTFCVWNRAAIPEHVARRVFQRNFSTKEGTGRGLGTYSIKLFGETYLGGRVDFTTSEADGTIFRLSLPRKGDE